MVYAGHMPLHRILRSFQALHGARDNALTSGDLAGQGVASIGITHVLYRNAVVPCSSSRRFSGFRSRCAIP